MKIGITGSKFFTQKLKIQDLLWKIKKEHPETEIVGLDNENGTDKFVKKFSLNFELNYKEFIPYYKHWNSYCAEERYKFGKKFSKKHIFATYNNYIKYCEKIVFFIENNEDKKHILIEM